MENKEEMTTREENYLFTGIVIGMVAMSTILFIIFYLIMVI